MIFCYFLSHYFVLVSSLGIPVHWLACKEDFTCYLGKAKCAFLVLYSLIRRTPTLKSPNKWTETVAASDSSRLTCSHYVNVQIMVSMKKFCKTKPLKVLIYCTGNISWTFSLMKHLYMTEGSKQDWHPAGSLPWGDWLSAKQRS